MAIDCHAHWIPPALAEALRRRRAAPRIESTPAGEVFITYQGRRPFDAALGDLAARQSAMRRWGVERQVLSLAGLFGMDSLPAEESAPLARRFNDAAAGVPQEFAAVASLPVADIALACAELQRACEAGLRGAILPAEGFRTLREADRFRPLFDLGRRLGCHFFIHPGPTRMPAEVPVLERPEDNAWQRRIVLETQSVLAEVMMTLNFSDYLDPYPEVTVQVANLGGTLPFLLERMDTVAREQLQSEELPSSRRPRCYVDTASFGPRAIELAVKCFGPERVLFGSDCPIFDSGRALEALAHTRLDDAVRDKLRFGNAARMMAAW